MCAPLPFKEHRGVGLSDVVVRAYCERVRRTVDPTRWPFNLTESSNRSLIQNDMALAIGPLRAIFLVTECGREPKRAQNGIHLWTVLHGRFQLDSHFMATGLAFRLMRQHPGLAIFAQPQHFASLAQLLAGQVVK